LVSEERGFRQEAPFDDTDIAVDTPIPDYTEDVSHPVFIDGIKEADIISQLQKMILQPQFEVAGRMMSLKLLPGFLGESKRPRDIGRGLAIERHPDYFSFCHAAALSNWRESADSQCLRSLSGGS